MATLAVGTPGVRRPAGRHVWRHRPHHRRPSRRGHRPGLQPRWSLAGHGRCRWRAARSGIHRPASPAQSWKARGRSATWLRGRGSPRGGGLAGRVWSCGSSRRRAGDELWRHEGPLVETSADGDGAAASPLADDDLPVPAHRRPQPRRATGRRRRGRPVDLRHRDGADRLRSPARPIRRGRPSPGARTGVSSPRQGLGGAHPGTPRRVSCSTPDRSRIRLQRPCLESRLPTPRDGVPTTSSSGTRRTAA